MYCFLFHVFLVADSVHATVNPEGGRAVLPLCGFDNFQEKRGMYIVSPRIQCAEERRR